jgi:hypothetical protein
LYLKNFDHKKVLELLALALAFTTGTATAMTVNVEITTMYANITFKLLGAAAVFGALLTSVPASAGGLGGDIINGFVPGLGTAADNFNAEIRNRSSDASVWNQVNQGLTFPNQPFRPAPGAAGPPQVRMGNFCGTPQGVFGPGPINPVGSSCHVDFPGGSLWGQVI